MYNIQLLYCSIAKLLRRKKQSNNLTIKQLASLRGRSGFKSGLTLVEVLIVIAIIGISATVLLSDLNPKFFLAESRDTKRKEDIQAIAIALQLYNTEIGGYPQEQLCDTSRGIATTSAYCDEPDPPVGDWSNQAYLIKDKLVTVKQVLKNMPRDPINDASYYYRYEPANVEDNNLNNLSGCDPPCQFFWIGARLESVDPGKERKIVYRCTNHTSLVDSTGCQVVEFNAATEAGSFDEPSWAGVNKR